MLLFLKVHLPYSYEIPLSIFCGSHSSLHVLKWTKSSVWAIHILVYVSAVGV